MRKLMIRQGEDDKRFVRSTIILLFKRACDGLFHRHGAAFCRKRFELCIPKFLFRLVKGNGVGA